MRECILPQNTFWQNKEKRVKRRHYLPYLFPRISFSLELRDGRHPWNAFPHRTHSGKKGKRRHYLPLLFLHISPGNFFTNLSPFGRIQQVQNTTSCHIFGTINLNSIGISTVLGGTVQTKIFSTNQKGLGTNSDLLRNARWNLCFSCTVPLELRNGRNP